MAEITVLDGPLGTELHRRGVATDLPSWSAAAVTDAPEVIRAIHADYARAGAVVHTANTFRAQPRILGERFVEVALRAVELVRSAVPEGHRVAGSVAPIADCYRPDLSPGEASRADHRALCRVLAEAGCDLLLCETFPVAEEGWVAVEEGVATGLPTWASFTAGPSADLMRPEELRRAAEGALERGAEAVLVNCVPASQTLPFVEAISDLGRPFGAYANAGSPDERVGWSADAEMGAARYLRYARSWLDRGATIVGGCCGTGVPHVRALAEEAGRR